MATALGDTAAIGLEDEEVASGVVSGSGPDVTVNHAGLLGELDPSMDDDATVVVVKASERDENNPTPPFPDLEVARTQMSGLSGGKPYSSFSRGRKWFIAVLMTLASIYSSVSAVSILSHAGADPVSPISSSIYVPAIPTLAKAFNTTEERINLTVTVYLVFQAITPAVFASLADVYGRRPVIIVLLVLYMAGCIGSALCPTSDYWLLMLMRILQSAGGSPLIAIGTGVMSDIATPEERGRYVGVFNMGGTFGVAIGPLIGGVLAFSLGWRSIFWFLTICCGVTLVPVIFLLPETLRALVGDGSLPPPLRCCNPQTLRLRLKEQKAAERRGQELEPEEKAEAGQVCQTFRYAMGCTADASQYRPWTSFLLFLQPDLALMLVWSSLLYAVWYAELSIFSTILRDKYHGNELIIGLCYLPNGLGTGVSNIIFGRLLDRGYRKEKARVGGDHRSKPAEFRLERTRFMLYPVAVFLLLGFVIAQMWTVQAGVHIAVPAILSFFMGVGTAHMMFTTVYGIDLFAGQSGAVTASFNLVRCIFGAITVSTIQLMNDRMGAGWSFVLLSGICLIMVPMPLCVLRYGPKWRLQRIGKNKRREEARRRRPAEKLAASEAKVS